MKNWINWLTMSKKKVLANCCNWVNWLTVNIHLTSLLRILTCSENIGEQTKLVFSQQRLHFIINNIL